MPEVITPNQALTWLTLLTLGFMLGMFNAYSRGRRIRTKLFMILMALCSLGAAVLAVMLAFPEVFAI